MRRLPAAGLLTAIVLAACSGEPAASTTAAPTTTTTAATTTPTTTTTIPESGVLVSIGVGEGIEYQPALEDQPAVGPSLLAADDDGGIHIYDPVGNRILSFTEGGDSSVDLGAAGIYGVTAMAAASDHLLLVEITFGPVHQRVHRITSDGVLIETADLPPGQSLEAGLSGVLAGDGDEIIVEYGGGAYFGVWDPATAAYRTSTALTIGGTLVTSIPPDLGMAGTQIRADLAAGLGGLRYLGTAADGTHAIVREEVRVTSAVTDVLVTVEWYSPTGEFLQSARVPSLQDQAIGAAPGIALMPDGRAITLVALADVVEVVELNPVNVRITDLTGSA